MAKIETLDKKKGEKKKLAAVAISFRRFSSPQPLPSYSSQSTSYSNKLSWSSMGWIELDNSYRLIEDFMMPSCGKAGFMFALWLMVLFGSNKQMLLQ